MNSKTGGIIATLATLVLCGLPGLILSCMGVVALATPTPPGTTDSAVTTGLAASAGLICGGLLLMVIPLAVGIFAWRRKPTPVAVQPAAATISTPPEQAPVPVAQPAANIPIPPAPAAPAPVPAAAPVQGSAAGMDASTQAVHDRIMALNRPSAPYQIVDGKAQGVDLIAEWKIVDAQWYEVFAKASLTKVFRIFMKFDPGKREVRAMDQELNVSWKKGVPSLSAEASFFRGQKSSVSFGIGYAFTENLAPGQVYKYKFNTNELKKPIQEAIAASGWTYKGVAFGKL